MAWGWVNIQHTALLCELLIYRHKCKPLNHLKDDFKNIIQLGYWMKNLRQEWSALVIAAIRHSKLWITAIGCESALQVFQVFLDVPQHVCALLQLRDLVAGQAHVDHAAHSSAVQHARQAQVHLVTDAVHTLKHTLAFSSSFQGCKSGL